MKLEQPCRTGLCIYNDDAALCCACEKQRGRVQRMKPIRQEARRWWNRVRPSWARAAGPSVLDSRVGCAETRRQTLWRGTRIRPPTRALRPADDPPPNGSVQSPKAHHRWARLGVETYVESAQGFPLIKSPMPLHARNCNGNRACSHPPMTACVRARLTPNNSPCTMRLPFE